MNKPTPSDELRTAAADLRASYMTLVLAINGLHLVLADWLEAEARRLSVAAPGWKHDADPHALAVARQINGGAP